MENEHGLGSQCCVQREWQLLPNDAVIDLAPPIALLPKRKGKAEEPVALASLWRVAYGLLRGQRALDGDAVEVFFWEKLRHENRLR